MKYVYIVIKNTHEGDEVLKVFGSAKKAIFYAKNENWREYRGTGCACLSSDQEKFDKFDVIVFGQPSSINGSTFTVQKEKVYVG